MTIKTIIAIATLALTGCASFHTEQTDVSYDAQGHATRQITTTVQASAILSAKSELTKFRATQTDKTQGASVGSLGLQATNHVVDALKEVNAILEKMPK